ncbi:MAG TPA: shikimate kinase [Lacipirellulaceae bacterium]|jgi:shikimate kinase
MMDPHVPILLIGYRGTGKSTVAKLLAARLGRDAVDADDEIERRAGQSIAAIFAEQGEVAFRDLETNVVDELSGRRRVVISLGGGAVLRAANRAAIRGGGQVVWLTARVDTIEARIAADATTALRRPDLTAAGGRAEIERLLAEREPMYRECATLIVATDEKTAEKVADEILAQL